jgi:hypothetical protein
MFPDEGGPGQYWPALHIEHEAELAELLPYPAAQYVHDVAADVLNVPAGHIKHEAAEVPPFTLLYLPAGHAWQVL